MADRNHIPAQTDYLLWEEKAWSEACLTEHKAARSLEPGKAVKKFEWQPGNVVFKSRAGGDTYTLADLLQTEPSSKLPDALLVPADQTACGLELEFAEAAPHSHGEHPALADSVDEDTLPKLARQLRENGTYQRLLEFFLLDLLMQFYLWRLRSLPERNDPAKGRPWLVADKRGDEVVFYVDFGQREVQDPQEITARIRDLLSPALNNENFWLELARQAWTHMTASILRDLKREFGPETLQAMSNKEFDQLFWKHWEGELLAHYLYLHAQDTVRAIIPRLPHRGPIEHLEWLLGLRREKPPPKRGQPTPEKPLRAAVIDGLLTTPSNRVYQELRRALALRGFSKNVGGWPSHEITGEGYSALAQLRPSPREPIPDDALEAYQQKMWALRKRLSDLDADVLDGIAAIWLENARHKDEMVVVTADDLLRLRGIKPRPGGKGRRGGYTDRQRQAIAESVENLAAVWLNVAEAPITREETDRRGRTRRVKESWAIESPALVVSSRLVQSGFPWGSRKVHAWRVRPGDFFAPYLLGPGRQTALLSQKALTFDPYRQTWEKRLARYFAYQWRVRARGGAYAQPFRVPTLLEECDSDPDWKRPRRLKERLEKALDTLEEHGVIAAWRYEKAGGSSVYEDPATGEKLPSYEPEKSRDWLNWTVLVEPPPEITQHYEKLLSPGKAAPAPAPARTPPRLGEEILAWRRREGLSQRAAAKLLGITQAYLSDIERGKKHPAPELAAKLRAAIGSSL